ncbi:Clp protease N-terminal domain-containing protein [Actinomycetospora sp. TBRC 11914]|uniref:Clp protease N-terminal domain-containing protein n=1 Tax=Actinomycetospora sp. TBRC 11914 TaxID=2729387 RepID=UPI00145F063C|nr:Clp protease N-terminal domain-containing protein [Actinomycetospora sp. TBRC 11914]NMO93612.1 hypothetical protein [Actinomycetospora sp. TBRC 11914]
MTATPIFDDLRTQDRAVPGPSRRTDGGGVVGGARRPSPTKRRTVSPTPDDATAYGAGCLDGPSDPPSGARPAEGELPGLVEAARREVEVLGHGRVGTEHLLLAVVRAGGEVGRAFGLRRAGAALLAAACAEGPVPEPLVAPDGSPALSVAAAGALARARARATTRDRPAVAADLALALLAAGRSATLLADLGVDRDDLADVLAREDLDLPVTAPVRPDARPAVPAPTPVGTPPTVALMLPAAAPRGPVPVPVHAPLPAGAVTTPLRIGPPPGSPARRATRRPVLDVPA